MKVAPCQNNLKDEQDQSTSPFNFNKDIHNCWSQDTVARRLNSITHKVSELSMGSRKVSDYDGEMQDGFKPFHCTTAYSTPRRNRQSTSSSRGIKRGCFAMNSSFSSAITFSPCQRSFNRTNDASLQDQPSNKAARISTKHHPFDFSNIFSASSSFLVGATSSITHPCFTPLKAEDSQGFSSQLISTGNDLAKRGFKESMLPSENKEYFQIGNNAGKARRARRVTSSTTKLANIAEMRE